MRKAAKHLFMDRWRTVAEIAELSGVHPNSIYTRLASGSSIDDAVKPRSRRGAGEVIITHAGMSLNIRQWAKKTGIAECTLRERLRQFAWPPHRALTEPAMNGSQRHTLKRYRERIAAISAGFRSTRNAQLIHRISTAFHTGVEMRG